MSNLSDTKLLSGRSAVIGYSTKKRRSTTDESTAAIELSPSAYEGSWAYVAGQMFYSNGLFWTSPTPPPIRTPTPREATNSLEQRQLRLTGFSTDKPGTPTQTGVVFQLSFTKQMLNSITLLPPNQTGANSYQLQLGEIADLTPGKVFYWKGKYLGSEAQESGYSRVQEQVYPEYIDKPLAINTIEGARTSSLQVSPYITAFSEIKQVSTNWRAFGANADGSVNLANQIFSTNNTLKNNKFDTLAYVTSRGATYYWQAQQVGIFGSTTYYSPWTKLQKQLQVLDIGTPDILNAIGVAVTTLVISEFKSSSSPRSELAQVEWEFYKTQNIDTSIPIDTVNLLVPVITTTTTTLATQNNKLVSLQKEALYYWRARFKSTAGNYSEYTTTIPVAFIIPANIDTPSSLVEEDVIVSELLISSYNSLYDYNYLNTTWKIYDTTNVQYDSNNNPVTTAVQTLSRTNIDTQAQSGSLIGKLGLKRGVKYYWTARYEGKDTNQISAYSNWVPLKSYIQAASIDTPLLSVSLPITFGSTIPVAVANGASNVVGPVIKFTASNFTPTSTKVSERLVSTVWTIYKVSSNGTRVRVTSITQSPTSDTLNFAELTYKFFDENSKYSVEVQYFGVNDSSEVSYPFTFTTIPVYKNVVSDPKPGLNSATGKPLVPGDDFEGGYYAGLIWNQVAETDSTVSLSIQGRDITKNINYIGSVTEATDPYGYQQNFSLTYFKPATDTSPAEYDASYQQADTPLFYIGQIVQLRSKTNSYIWMEGIVVRAFSNIVRIGIYKTTEDTNKIPRTSSISIPGGWWILAKYRIILGQSSSTYYGAVTLLENQPTTVVVPRTTQTAAVTWKDVEKPIPYECFSLSEGWKSTNALANLPYSDLFCFAAYKARNTSLTINGKTYADWYIPSRDELLLCYYYLNKYTGSSFNLNYPYNLRPSSTFYNLGYFREPLNYQTFGAFPDEITDWLGTNRNSVIKTNEYNLVNPYWADYAVNKDLGPRTHPVKNTVMSSAGDFGTSDLSTSTLYYSRETFADANRPPFLNSIPLTRKEYDLNPMYPSTTLTYNPAVRVYSMASAAGGEYARTSYSNSNYFRLVRRELV